MSPDLGYLGILPRKLESRLETPGMGFKRSPRPGAELNDEFGIEWYLIAKATAVPSPGLLSPVLLSHS